MNKLKALRLKRNFTQAQLAQKTGISQAYINELESGKKTNPSSTVLNKLSRALEVHISELLDDFRD